MYFAFQVRFLDARIRKDLLEIFWYSIFVSSRKVLRNSRFEKLYYVSNPRIVPSQILDARKKRKKKYIFSSILPTLVPIARLCGKSRLDSRIFGRIFRETRLLRIIQTNHEFSMNSRLGIDPLL